MNTQIIVLTSGSIYATSGVIDLYNDIPISLNYNIADIKEPQKRNADYSKTITVPGSNNNNQLLGHIYEIGIDRLYNPNKKVEVIVTYDTVSVFKGYMRLTKITKLRDDRIEYELEIRGRLDDLFTNLIDLRLTDLSWTDLDHTLNRTNIINSWSTPVGSNYVYPFIDYGYEQNINNINVDHLFPAVYIKEVWDRTFRTAGFQYSSSFLTSTYFKSLIMPFTGENMRLTTLQIANREFQAERVTTDMAFIPFTTSGVTQVFDAVFNDDTTGTNADDGNNYNTSTGRYTVPNNGLYNFVANISAYGLATPHGANQFLNWDIDFMPRIIVNGLVKGLGAFRKLVFAPTPSVSTPTTSTVETNSYVLYSGYFNAGDVVYVDIEAIMKSKAVGFPNNVDYQLVLQTGAYFYAKVDPIIKNGETVTFVNTLPSDMKIVDLLISIIKMFNLYFEYDPDIPNKIYIEPRNDYYNSTIQDWSDKLDAGQEPEIIPMGALNAKRYSFSYKADGDVLNDTYKNTFGEVYAQKNKDIDNDFLKNEEKMEVLFSPTPQYGLVGTGKFYPALYNVDANLKIVHNKSMNPRILYYGGLKTCPTWYLYTLNGNSFTYYGALTSYPYCGMMDDPSTPTESLDFEAPFEIYYTPTFGATYSNNNIYNKHWKQFIDEITDYNSSIVTAWFWLKPSDIIQVDFRHVYRFLNQNFRLNKIYDYNPSEVSLTKCEFIKVKTGVPFVKSSHLLTGSAQSYYHGVSLRIPAPPTSSTSGTNHNVGFGTLNSIMGKMNFISPNASNISIVGDENSVGMDARNINIINSSGCIVAGGLVNVSILNSSGITVTTSNTHYFNGVLQSSSASANYWTATGNDILNNNSDRVGIAGRLYGTGLHNNAGSVSGTASQYIASGTYTPTTNTLTNLATATGQLCQWIRVGNVVTVSGCFIDVDPTLTATATSFRFDLPIPSALTSQVQVAGTAFCGGIAGLGAEIIGRAASDEAVFQFVSTDINVQTWSFTMT